MPQVQVSRNIKAVELMAATDPGDVLIDALRQLGSEGAQAARQAGAGPNEVLSPRLQLVLTMVW